MRKLSSEKLTVMTYVIQWQMGFVLRLSPCLFGFAFFLTTMPTSDTQEILKQTLVEIIF